MTPKEKAQELIDKFSQVDTPNWDSISGTIEQEQIGFYSGKECALIAVDEIINEVVNQKVPIYNYDKVMDYWQQVKTEIEKL